MSSILNKWSEFKELPKDIKTDIKYFHIFLSGVIFFVTNKDQVYVLPKSDHAYAINKPYVQNIEECFTLFRELCDQNICEFFEGNQCFFAKTVNKEIMSWGSNVYAQLGRSQISPGFISPGLIGFSGKNIVDIKYANNQYLALTSDGLIYHWGQSYLNKDNLFDRFNSNYMGLLYINTPIRLGENYGIKHKIKSILCQTTLPMCSYNYFFALTTNGQVYFWTKIKLPSKSLIGNTIYVTKYILQNMLPINSIVKISNMNLYLILLTENGFVYKLHMEQYTNKPVKAYDSKKWRDIKWTGRDLLLQSEENLHIYQVNEFTHTVTETKYNNFYEYLFNNLYEKSLKTMRVSSEGFLEFKEIEFNSNSTKDILVENYQILNENNGKFIKEFKIQRLIGFGGFGKVYQANDLMDETNKIYAIKQILINTNEADCIFDEYRILSRLDDKYVVEVESAWIEVKKQIWDHSYIYIQMELCLGTLKNLSELKTKLLNRQSGQPLDLLEYYISIELFNELTECLNYLHSLKPPIIHRDLKPTNVLYTDGQNGRLLKLCDFGLAKLHQKSSHTQGAGDFEYMAPEVKKGRKYNLKADVYSLGLIANELFDFNPKNGSTSKGQSYRSTYLEHNFKGLKTLINKMTANYEQRIDSNTVLNEIKNISVDKRGVIYNLLISLSDSQLTKIKNNVFYNYLHSKLNLTRISEFCLKK